MEIGRAETLAANLAVTRSDAPKTIALYEKVLGFKADGNWLSMPGTSLRIHLSDTRASDTYTQPARAMLRLLVRDIDALTASLKSAGFSVITTGGAPVTLPQGQRVIILRDPNNFFVQLMETRSTWIAELSFNGRASSAQRQSMAQAQSTTRSDSNPGSQHRVRRERQSAGISDRPAARLSR